MKITFEGLPGTRKDEIFLWLKKNMEINIPIQNNIEWDQLYLTDQSKYALGYYFDKLINLYYQFENQDSSKFFNSIYAFKKVYLEILLHHNTITQYEYDLFMKYYRLMYQKPDIIIYFFGTFENSYQRALENAQQNKTHIYSQEEFKQLYYQYESVFDNDNCNIPIFKVNIDDSFKYVTQNLKEIIIRCQT